MPSTDRFLHFIEDIGLLFEESGMPRMMGRIIGHLLVCTPPHQTASQLVEGLSASKGSISTNTRALLTMGVIERMALPGQRATCIRIAPGTWQKLILAEQVRMRRYLEAAERGLVLLADSALEDRSRLVEFRDFFLFLETEYPLLLQHYTEWRAAREVR